MSEVADLVADVVAGRAPGTPLTEPEAQRIAAAIGIGVPPTGGAITGDRVVVKAIGPAHKSRLGGVRVVPNTPAAIADAARVVGAVPGATGTLVTAFVDHEVEILAGVRWTDGFGPVVTIGSGGTRAEEAPAPAILVPAIEDRILDVLAAAPGTNVLAAPPRGDETVPAALLADLAARLLDLGRTTMPHLLTEFEMNPVTIVDGRLVALDALAVAGGDRPPWRPRRDLGPLLDASSLAVMGVSDRMNPGRVILRNVLAAGFPTDRVTVIKPGVDEIDGCRAVAGVADLDPVDLLVLAVPAAGIPEIVADVADRGVARAVVLIPGGLGERPGTAGAADRLREITARPGAPLLLGPNTMGIRTVRYDTTFIPPERMTPGPSREAPLAVVAQSGAFTLARLDRLPGLRPRVVATVGNQIDVTAGEIVAAVADDPAIRVVAAYLEGVAPGDGDRILRACRRLTDRGGTMLWYRGGRTAAGVAAATTHTAAVATDDTVASAVAASAGLLEAATLDEWDDLLAVSVGWADRAPAGRRLGVVSNAGFEAVAAADALRSLDLTRFADRTRDRLAAVIAGAGLDTIAAAGNPVDLTPVADAAVYGSAVAAVLDDPGVDLAVIGCIPYSPAIDPDALTAALIPYTAHPTPWVAVIDAGARYAPLVAALRTAGIPVLPAMDRAVRAIGAMRSAQCAMR